MKWISIKEALPERLPNVKYSTVKCLVVVDGRVYMNYFKIEADGGYDECGELDILKTCQYLHQLQNLYYALTGKELTYNQPSRTV